MLYILNKNGQTVTECVKRASGEDVILLIEGAVCAAISSRQLSLVEAFDKAVAVYALTPDMQARGILPEQCYEQISYVDYAGFVELVESNNPVRSCF